VIGFEYQLDFPADEAKVIVGENVTYNRFKNIKDSIDGKFDEVNFQNNTYTNGSNGGSFYVITSNDKTPESDTNVYSAKRTLKRFTRKTENDNISALWTFLHGGGNRRGIRTKDYENAVNENNFFGRGFELVMKENGISRLEIDELFVRARSFFTNLEIRQMSYVGGNFVFSGAGSKIYYVEKLDEDGDYTEGSAKYYRCYLYSDNGTTATTNRWVAKDQALCQTFNIDSGVHSGVANKRYWRLVEGTGKQIIVSKALAALRRWYDDQLAAINDLIPVSAADESTIASRRATLISNYNSYSNSIRNGVVPAGFEGEDFTEYQYVDLSNISGEYEAGSGVPEAEDSIVQFGSQAQNSTRKGLVFIKVEGEGSPAIIVYDAITTFQMPTGSSVQLSPHGNIIHGTFYSVVNGKSLESIISEGDVKAKIVTLCEHLWQTHGDNLKTGTHYLGFNVNFTPGTSNFYYQKADPEHSVTEDFFKSVEGQWESYGNATIKDLVKQIYKVVGDKKVTIYSTIPNSGASEYDLCLRGTTWYDGYNTQGTQGACEISMFKDGVWELLKESVNGVIANLGSEIRAEIYGVDGSSGIRATLTELQAFTQKITFDNEGNITNISKSGLITQSNFATMFATNVDAQGVAKTAEITAYVDAQISGITISADQIDFIGKTVINGKFVVDAQGCVTMNDATITGVVNANSGSIGGFTIASGRIGSVASAGGGGGGLAIYDDLFRIGGTNSYTYLGNNLIPSIYGGQSTLTGHINNSTPNVGSGSMKNYNYGLRIDVSGADFNFALNAHAAILAPAIFSNKVGYIDLTGSTYKIDLPNKNIFYMYANAYSSVTLPTASTIAVYFGYSSLPTDFGIIFTLVCQWNSERIQIKNIMNEDAGYEDWDMAAGDVLMLMATNIHGNFHYKKLFYLN
jgi:hypothetical protein